MASASRFWYWQDFNLKEIRIFEIKYIPIHLHFIAKIIIYHTLSVWVAPFIFDLAGNSKLFSRVFEVDDESSVWLSNCRCNEEICWSFSIFWNRTKKINVKSAKLFQKYYQQIHSTILTCCVKMASCFFKSLISSSEVLPFLWFSLAFLILEVSSEIINCESSGYKTTQKTLFFFKY